jgi:tetratricopeptide (TPR) repeat protein
MASLSAHAAEELFDTKAAVQHMEQGIAFLKSGNYDSAVEEFEESAAISPDAEAFYYLGYAYYQKSRKGDADSRSKSRENFEKAYEIDPNFSPTRFKPSEPAPAPVQKQEQTAPAAQPATQPSSTAAEAAPAPPASQPKP